MAEDESPLEQVVELAVYAPVGLFLAARDAVRKHLPGLIDTGRDQVARQVALARMMGHYAVEEAQKDAGRRVQQANDLLASVRPGTAPAPTPPARDEWHPEPETPAPSRETFPEVAAAATPVAANGAAPEVGSLAIPGYASLSASQVVQRLDGLSPAQLEDVRHFEAATRGRKTILGRIAQLQSDTN